MKTIDSSVHFIVTFSHLVTINIHTMFVYSLGYILKQKTLLKLSMPIDVFKVSLVEVFLLISLLLGEEM